MTTTNNEIVNTDVKEKISKLFNLALNNSNEAESKTAMQKAELELRIHDLKYSDIKTSYDIKLKEFMTKRTKSEKDSKKTRYAHVKTAISGKIDIILLNKKQTIKQIAKNCNCTEYRVKHHIEKDLKKAVRSNVIALVHFDDKNRIFIA